MVDYSSFYDALSALGCIMLIWIWKRSGWGVTGSHDTRIRLEGLIKNRITRGPDVIRYPE